MTKVLFVDDEPKILDAIMAVLSDEPYELLGVTEPRKALELIEAEAIDVVVADERMPDLSGSELLSIVRQRKPEVARIILTGHAELSTTIRAINEAEICRFLQKPIDEGELIQTLRETLQSHGKLSLGNELSRVASPEELARLSPREVEVLQMALSGKPTKDIAQETAISPHTVRNHLKSIYRKLGVHSQRELMSRLLARP